MNSLIEKRSRHLLKPALKPMKAVIQEQIRPGLELVNRHRFQFAWPDPPSFRKNPSSPNAPLRTPRLPRVHRVIPTESRIKPTNIEQKNRRTEQQRNRGTEEQSNRETEEQRNRATEKPRNRRTEQQNNRTTEKPRNRTTD
jgi:hypothetical protein